MKILLNDNGFVSSYATIGNILDSIEVDETLIDLQDFEENFEAYYYENGTLIKSYIKEEELVIEKQKEELRMLRQRDCFLIINRGQLWYNSLTEEQLNELNIWYKSWLDVTDTLVIPTKPSWLE
jgi:hypothetical protein